MAANLGAALREKLIKSHEDLLASVYKEHEEQTEEW